MDLRLASSNPAQSAPSSGFWLVLLGIVSLSWLLPYLVGKVLPAAWRSKIVPLTGPLLVLSFPSLMTLAGSDAQRWALADVLTLALTLLATWSAVRIPEPTKIDRIVSGCFVLTAMLALIEQAFGHAVIDLGPRLALQGALLCAVFANLGQCVHGAGQRFELRISAAFLAAPLLARIVAVGSWTVLLGVAVPEHGSIYTLAIWSLSALGLCATTFPRGKGPTVVTFAFGTALSIALIFLVYLHYQRRFGTIQAKFDAITLPVFGVFFPYPQWQPLAVSSVFAVSVIFACVLVLRCFGQPNTRGQGLGLALWFCAGIGLNRGLDLMCLALAATQLRHTFAPDHPADKVKSKPLEGHL